MRTLALAFALVLTASGVSAQSDWRPVPQGTYLSIDALGGGTTLEYRPTTNSGEVFDLNQRLAVALVAGQVPVNSRLMLTATLPVGFASASSDGPGLSYQQTGSNTGIGNLYLGAIAQVSPEASAELGVWIPTSTDDRFVDADGTFDSTVLSAGSVTDFERLEAYVQGLASVRLLLRGGLPISDVVGVRGAVSPVFAYDTRSHEGLSESPRGNFAFTGGAFVDARFRNLTLTTGTTGRVEPGAGNISTLTGLSMSAMGSIAVENLPVRPALLLRLPLVGDTGGSDVIFGASLGLPLQ